MKSPYYQDDAVTLYYGDCREIVPTLGKFDAVITDPPYGKVKGDFDEEWTNRNAMLADCVEWRDMMFSAMKPNATLYWFAWPSLAGKIEALIAERLNTIAHIVWIKPNPRAQKICPETLRAPVAESERIIMAEHYGADNRALGESGYAQKCDEAKGFVFEPLRAYFECELIRSGVKHSDIREWFASHGYPKYVTDRHTFSSSQWEMPTKENYERLRQCFNGLGAIPPDYLRKEYEELRKEYEELRRYYNCETGEQKTEIWRFAPDAGRNASGHPTIKPLELMRYMVKLSCRPSGIILDPFAGSGTTGRAAKDLGRKCVLIEREEKYCEIAANRMRQEVFSFDGEKNHSKIANKIVRALS